jgi:hypothetical protein
MVFLAIVKADKQENIAHAISFIRVSFAHILQCYDYLTNFLLLLTFCMYLVFLRILWLLENVILLL